MRHRNSKPLPPTSDKCDGTKGEVFLGDSSAAVLPEGKFTINPVHKKGGVDIKSYKCGCYKPSQIYILQSRTNTKHENRPYRLWMARLYQKEEWLYQGVGKGVKGGQEPSPHFRNSDDNCHLSVFDKHLVQVWCQLILRVS